MRWRSLVTILLCSCIVEDSGSRISTFWDSRILQVLGLSQRMMCIKSLLWVMLTLTKTMVKSNAWTTPISTTTFGVTLCTLWWEGSTTIMNIIFSQQCLIHIILRSLQLSNKRARTLTIPTLNLIALLRSLRASWRNMEG